MNKQYLDLSLIKYLKTNPERLNDTEQAKLKKRIRPI